MKKTLFSMRNLEPAYGGTVLITMAVFFAFGAIVGSFTASNIMIAGDGRLYEILTNYLMRFAGDYVRPSFWSAFFVNFRYQVLLFLFSFISLGVVMVPATVALRGFFLSLAVTGFVRMLGINGAFLSFAVFGLQNILALPVLLLLSAQVYSWAKGRYQSSSAGGRRVMSPPMSDKYLSLIGICFAVLFVCALIEYYLSPLFIDYIHNFL